MTHSHTCDALAEALRQALVYFDEMAPGHFIQVDKWRTALAEYEAEPKGWRTMDSVPKDGAKVDLWVRPWDAFANGNAGRVPGAWYEDGEWWRWVWTSRRAIKDAGEPTHWRPLPLPPEPQK